MATVEIPGTRSEAYDEQGNPIECGLEDGRIEANPDGFRGKVIEDIKTIQSAVYDILKNNLDLRRVENRKLVRMLVETKLKRQVSDESVPRACREIQNTQGLFLPEVDDKRAELEKINHEYYSK